MSESPTKYYFRQRQRNRLYDVVVGAVERAAEEDGLRKKDMAKVLGLPPSQISRLLSGPANWETDTVSDLLFAAGAELDFTAVRHRDRVKQNRFHPLGEMAAVVETPAAFGALFKVPPVDLGAASHPSDMPNSKTRAPPKPKFSTSFSTGVARDD